MTADSDELKFFALAGSANYTERPKSPRSDERGPVYEGDQSSFITTLWPRKSACARPCERSTTMLTAGLSPLRSEAVSAISPLMVIVFPDSLTEVIRTERTVSGKAIPLIASVAHA